MNKSKGFTIIEMSIFILLLAGIIGYGSNIYKLTQCDFEAPYKCEAIHAIGLFPVVGVFTGYMSFAGE